MPRPCSPRRFVVVVFVLLVGLAALDASPAAAVPVANLGGVVRAVDGTPLGDVQVLAFERSLGRRLAARSDAAGRYRFLGLEVGEWTVEATLPGYTIAVVEDLRLDAGVTRRLDLELEPSDFEEMVVTSHFSPLVPTGIDGAVTLGRADFDALPFLDRSLRRVENLLDGPPAAVEERLLDGVLSSGVLSSGDLPLAAADQVALRTLHSSAVYAGGSGVVSLVTRAGTNRLRGDVFVLHTDDELQEGAAPRVGRWTWLGGSVGGALVEDSVHAFVAIEDVDAEELDAEELDAVELDAVELDAEAMDAEGSQSRATERRRSALHLAWSPDPGTVLRLRGVESETSPVADVRELLLAARVSVGSRFHHGVGVSLREAGDLHGGELDDGEVRWDLASWLTTDSAEHELRAGFRLFEDGAEDRVEDGAEDTFGDDGRLGGTRGIWLEDELRLPSGWSLRAGVRWDRRKASGLVPGDGDEELSPRLGVAWDVSGNGRHVLRASAGRFVAGAFASYLAGAGEVPYVDRASLAWSWRLSPFLGLAFDARRLEIGDDFQEESADVAIRGRFTDAVRFQVRWGVFERAPAGGDAGGRHRVVGSVTVDTPWSLRFGAVYRYLTAAASRVDPASQLDVRLARSFELRGEGGGPQLEASLEIFDLLDQANNFDHPHRPVLAADHTPTVLRPTGRVGLRLRF